MPTPTEIRESLSEWGNLIEQLLAGEATVQELSTYFDPSPRTIRRALERLVDEGLVTRNETAPTTYQLTHFGRQIAWEYCDHQQRIETLAEADDLLSRLPEGAPLGREIMTDAEIVIEPPEVPESAWQPVDRAVDRADQVRGIAPKVTASYIDTFYEQIVEQETEVELLLPRDVYASIIQNYEREWRSAIVAENAWFGSVEEVPPFGMLIIDGIDVWVGVYHEERGSALEGTLRNDSPIAVAWAVDLFQDYRANATNVLELS